MTCPRGVRQGGRLCRALWSRPTGVTWHNVISATFGGARPVSLCEVSQITGSDHALDSVLLTLSSCFSRYGAVVSA
jgi:hypothetical protein